MTSEKKWKKLCWDLYYESKTGNAEEAEALIQKGACVNNQEGDNATTPLYISSRNGHKYVVEILLKYGADANLKETQRGQTPLHIAANKSVVDALIKAGANINVQDSKGKTPLHEATDINIIRSLLDAGADTNLLDSNLRNPLHHATKDNIIEILSKAGADINLQDINARTPLHEAGWFNRIEAVESLLRNGCNPNITDSIGNTALQMAAGRQNVEIVEILTDARSNIRTKVKLKACKLRFDLPEEILKMDEEAIELFITALTEGEEDVFDIRLMIVGHLGVGKTSLTKGLLHDVSAEQDTTSTDGIDIHVFECQIDLESEEWIPVSSDQQHRDIEGIVAKVVNDIQRRKALKQQSKTRQESIEQSVPSKRQQLQQETPLSSERKPYVEDGTKPTMVSSKSTSTADLLSNQDIVQSVSTPNDLLQRVVQRSKQTNKLMAPVHIWDFGGQHIFYTTHQTFLSARCIYLLVFDLSRDLNDIVSVEAWIPGLNTSKMIKEFIAFWVNSIIIFASTMKYVGTPKIILVGTHLDFIPEEERDTRKRHVFGKIREFFKNHPAFDHLVINEEFALNTKNLNDSSYALLRSKILHVASREPFWREKRPTSWIPLEEYLHKIQLKGIKIIERSELEHINSISQFNTLPAEQLDLFLRFHHALGYILCFPDHDMALKSSIILDPRLLITALKCLITAERFCKSKLSRTLWRQLSDYGMISKANIFKIWNESENPEISENKDHLLKMMEKLDLISRPKIYLPNGEEHDIQHFYIPCMIQDQIKNEERDKVVPKDLFLTLLLGNANAFLPQAVFNKLVAVCLHMWPIAKDVSDKNLLFSNFVGFAVDSNHTMMMEYKISHINMYIKRNKQTNKLNRNLCLRLLEFIISRMENCFNSYTETAAFPTGKEPSTILVQVKLVCCQQHKDCTVELRKLSGNEKRPCQHHELDERLDGISPWFTVKKGANIEEEEEEEDCGPECNGIVGIEQEEPTDRDLGRFARRLNIPVYLLGKGLAIPDVDITTITENPRYEETEKKLRVLQEWRARMSRRENPTWQKLKDNLELIDRNAKHKVCKIRGPVHINEFLTARNMQFDTPSTQMLHSLGDRIDPFKCFDLGIELGLTRSKIDQIRINHPYNVAQQIRKILSVWQSNESEIKPKGDKQFTLPTFLVLSNALDEVKISVLKETIEDND